MIFCNFLKKPILVVQACRGPDYLADMVTHYIYENLSTSCKIVVNNHPDYLFTDFPESTPLYGMGFTVYRKLNPLFKERVELHSKSLIIDSIKNRSYSKIIWTSIRRCSDFLSIALDNGYTNEELIAVDGEDDSLIPSLSSNLFITKYMTYYKRELNSEGASKNALPISFKFPASHSLIINKALIKKNRILAICDPRFKNTYIYKSETAYFAGYEKSLFAVTTKKAGWDCLRHYEILASQCLPIFLGSTVIPMSTMVEWDRELQEKVNNLWQDFSLIDASIENLLPQWNELMESFYAIFKAQMLTNSYDKIFDF